MLDYILSRKEEIKKILESSTAFIKDLTSEELFQVITAFSKDPEIREIIKKNSVDILDRCSTDFDMFNYFTILSLKINGINKEECDYKNSYVETSAKFDTTESFNVTYTYKVCLVCPNFKSSTCN